MSGRVVVRWSASEANAVGALNSRELSTYPNRVVEPINGGER